MCAESFMKTGALLARTMSSPKKKKRGVGNRMQGMCGTEKYWLGGGGGEGWFYVLHNTGSSPT